MYFLYSAQVVAAIVRSVPRASAGLSKFAASPVPAAPPAPIRVCASSMNRMIGFGEACTSSMTWRRRFSNSPFMLAPACSRPTSSVRSATSLSCGGTSPRTMRWREAFDDGGLADARLAHQDGIVLPPAHQDIDELADFLVAPDDRVHFAASRLFGQIGGELLEGFLLAHLGRRHRAAGLAGRGGAAAHLEPVGGALTLFGRAGHELREIGPSASPA